MTTYPCPNGHLSTDAEYCTECGKKLSGPSGITPPAAPGAAPASATGEVCPDCGTPRATPTATFCEVCRYNFVTHQPWSPVPPALATVAPPPPPPTAPPNPVLPAAPVVQAPSAAPAPLPAADVARRWEAVVTVDPSLYADPDPQNPVPVGVPERVFPLDFPENLIGRRSERRAIFPEIDLSGDSGVSSRHAILRREADGSIAVVDVGSTNGTQVNGADIVPGVRTPLHDGDQVTVGCWSRITVRVMGGTK